MVAEGGFFHIQKSVYRTHTRINDVHLTKNITTLVFLEGRVQNSLKQTAANCEDK